MANRTFRLTGKWPEYNEFGEQTHTGVQIATVTGPYMQTTETIPGNVMSYTDEDLVKLALDMNFKTVHSDRALPEAIKDMEEAKRTMAEFERFSDQAKADNSLLTTKVEDLIARLETAENVRNGVFEKLIQQISDQGVAIKEVEAMITGFMNDVVDMLGGEEPTEDLGTDEGLADEAL